MSQKIKNNRIICCLLILYFLWGCGPDTTLAPGDNNPTDANITEAGNPPKPKKLREVRGVVPPGETDGSCLVDEVVAFDPSGVEKSGDVLGDCSFVLDLATGTAWGLEFARSADIFSMEFNNSPQRPKAPVYFQSDGDLPIDLGQITHAGEGLVPQFEPSLQNDQDADGFVDFKDGDDDNDGTLDRDEADCDGDGIIDDFESDSSTCTNS